MDAAPEPHHHHHEPEKHGHRVEVVVHTTSGSYPRHGQETESATTIVGVVLEKAKAALKLTDTSNWEAHVEGRLIDPTKSFEDNHLEGHVKIQWGPREGGGGS